VLRLGREANRAQAAERLAMERLFHSSFENARALRHSGQIGHRWAALQAIQQAAEIARTLHRGKEQILALRNEAIACMTLPDVRIEPEWNGSPPGCVGLAFDSGYKHYVQAHLDGRISLRRVADDREIRLLRVTMPPGQNRRVYMGFSPRDQYLVAWFGDSA